MVVIVELVPEAGLAVGSCFSELDSLFGLVEVGGDDGVALAVDSSGWLPPRKPKGSSA